MRQPIQKAVGNPRPADPPDFHGGAVPLRLFILTLISIFFAELISMIAVRFLEFLPYYVTALIDAAIMVLLIFPILYFFSFRPLLQYIEKLQQTEQALHQKEELQERFFNSIDVTIAYMDRNFNFIKVNDAYAKSAEGRTPEYFEGKNHFVLYPHAENQAIFQRVVDTAEPYFVYRKPFEYPDQPGRGVTYWDWSLQPVKGRNGKVEGLVLSLMDVTERQRAEEKVEVERSRLRSILDALPDGVYIVNQQFDVEYTNPVIEKEFGPVGDRKCYTYFHDRDEVCEWCKNPVVFKGMSVQWEWYSSRTGRTYEVFDTPLLNSGGSISKLKLIHDITMRKKAEAELEHRNRELQALSVSEHRQREVADALREAAQLLTQSLDLDIVLNTLTHHLRLLIRADTASVMFPEGETVLGVRASEGYEQWTDPNKILAIKVIDNTNPLFQRLISSSRSFVIQNVAEEPNWVVYPGTEAIKSRLFVPIMVEDRLIGIVGLGKSEVGYFTREHVQWAEALVGQAAVAIQNAWLFQQVQAGRERMQILSHRLVEIQENERLFIARELHDQASQTLTSLILGLGSLEKEAHDAQAVQAKTIELKAMTDQVFEELHRLAINLRPASLDHLGLAPALEQFTKTFSQESHLPIRFKSVGFREGERLLPDVETTLYRIVQEALNNVVRHAKASRVDVVLERSDDSMIVIVEDDGQGFDMELVKDTGRLGLLGMKERAEMLGGTLTVESVPGGGTTLFAEVPYDNSDLARG
jgi:PAS domain S-box-containing protein